MSFTRMIGKEIAATTVVSTASSVGHARLVRVYNGHSAAVFVAVSTSTADVVGYGSITVAPATVEFVDKDYKDVMWAGHAAVKFAKVGFTN
jgi:hypothetical protein